MAKHGYVQTETGILYFEMADATMCCDLLREEGKHKQLRFFFLLLFLILKEVRLDEL